MPSHRLEKIEEMVHQEVAAIVQREVELPTGVLATITRVKLAPEGRDATIYVSVLPADLQVRSLERLEGCVHMIEHFLRDRLRVRPVPHLSFVLDKGAEKASRVEELLQQVEKEGI